MKFLMILILLFSQIGCAAKKAEVVNAAVVAPQAPVALNQLAGLRIQSLFVVLFEKDFDAETWASIFQKTNQLSLNQKRLRELSGDSSDKSQDERADVIGKNSVLLTDLGNQSLFMMSWSIENENCKFSKSTLKVTCKPFQSDNPLNGGLPVSLDSLVWMNPDPVKEEIKSPYLKLTLTQNDASKGPLYSVTLRLKLESVPIKNSNDAYWFKGDALPLSGSQFQKADGTLTSSFYPYGYAEMTLVE